MARCSAGRMAAVSRCVTGPRCGASGDAGGCGRDPALYGAHSLRIGAATAALASGVPPQLIRLMGRWSSDVYELYCRMSLQSALRVGVTITSAAGVRPVTRFEEEQLELLPQDVAEIWRDVVR